MISKNDRRATYHIIFMRLTSIILFSTILLSATNACAAGEGKEEAEEEEERKEQYDAQLTRQLKVLPITGFYINSKDPQERALHQKQMDQALALIEGKADPNTIRPQTWATILFETRSPEIIEKLLALGASITYQIPSGYYGGGQTPLHRAAHLGSTKKAMAALLAHANPVDFPRDKNGYTPLHWLCWTANQGYAKFFLKQFPQLLWWDQEQARALNTEGQTPEKILKETTPSRIYGCREIADEIERAKNQYPDWKDLPLQKFNRHMKKLEKEKLAILLATTLKISVYGNIPTIIVHLANSDPSDIPGNIIDYTGSQGNTDYTGEDTPYPTHPTLVGLAPYMPRIRRFREEEPDHSSRTCRDICRLS